MYFGGGSGGSPPEKIKITNWYQKVSFGQGKIATPSFDGKENSTPPLLMEKKFTPPPPPHPP